MKRAVLSCVLGFAAMAGVAVAATPSGHDTHAPLDFSADHIELQDNANRAILSGDVVIHQAEMTLDADRLIVHYTGKIVNGSPQVSRLDAAGGVSVTRPDQTAKADYGIYDLNARVITMFGNVHLTQGGNTIGGGRLRIDLDSGRAVIDGAPVGGGSGPGGAATQQSGRVTGQFSVPDRKK